MTWEYRVRTPHLFCRRRAGNSVSPQQKPSCDTAEEHKQCRVDVFGEKDSCYGKGGYAGDGIEVEAVVGVDAGRFADCVDACEHEAYGDRGHALLH